MRKAAGYTLIELLVVISIISLLSVVGFVNFKGFSSDQITIKAVGQIQSLLRLTQSNATSSTLCNGVGATSWSLKFIDASTMELRCNPNDFKHKSYTLESAQVDKIIGSGCGTTSTIPLTLTYSVGLGALAFSSSTASPACLSSASWTFTIKNVLDTTKTKTFTLTKGGAINVQ